MMPLEFEALTAARDSGNRYGFAYGPTGTFTTRAGRWPR